MYLTNPKATEAPSELHDKSPSSGSRQTFGLRYKTSEALDELRYEKMEALDEQHNELTERVQNLF